MILTEADATQPVTGTIPYAMKMSGLTRGMIYRLIRTGKIEARKCGVRTLIVMETLHGHIDSQKYTPSHPNCVPRRGEAA